MQGFTPCRSSAPFPRRRQERGRSARAHDEGSLPYGSRCCASDPGSQEVERSAEPDLRASRLPLPRGRRLFHAQPKGQHVSGGEYQRISLASQLGSKLSNTLYVLDEPSIGLHPSDTDKLIQVMHSLRDHGNTLVVVEHDTTVMRVADLLVEVGPLAGAEGGEIVASSEGRIPEDP